MKTVILSPIMPQTTIVEARRILGSRYKLMTDDQIKDIVLTLTLIGRKQIQTKGSKKAYGNVNIHS